MVHRLALWLLAAALAAHMLLTAFGGPVPVSDAVYLGVAAFASVVCLARGATYRPERLPWLALGAGLGLSAIGEFIGVFWLAQLDEPPYRAWRTRATSPAIRSSTWASSRCCAPAPTGCARRVRSTAWSPERPVPRCSPPSSSRPSSPPPAARRASSR